MVTRTAVATTNQPDLFQHLDAAPLGAQSDAPDLTLNVELIAALRAALRDARALYGYSRERVVDRMNACLDRTDQVTVRQLNAWTAVSQEKKNFPSAWLPAFCWATRSLGPFQALLHPLGFEPADQADRMAQRLGELELECARLRRERTHIKHRLGG